MASKKTATTTTTEKTPSPVSTKTGSTSPATGPTHEQIAKRAYELYLARGADHGRHQEDWSQAERELKLGRQ